MNIIDAARYIIHLSYQNNRSLIPLKLQKVLYFCQGWSFVWDGKQLFPEEFEVWQYGPVNVIIYELFRKYGKDEIPESEGSASGINKKEKETLEAVWNIYSSWSAAQLVEETQKHTPCMISYKNDTIMTNEDIKKFFLAMY